MGAALLRAEPVIAVKRANRNFFITVPVSVCCVWYLVFKNKQNKQKPGFKTPVIWTVFAVTLAFGAVANYLLNPISCSA